MEPADESHLADGARSRTAANRGTLLDRPTTTDVGDATGPRLWKRKSGHSVVPGTGTTSGGSR